MLDMLTRAEARNLAEMMLRSVQLTDFHATEGGMREMAELRDDIRPILHAASDRAWL